MTIIVRWRLRSARHHLFRLQSELKVSVGLDLFHVLDATEALGEVCACFVAACGFRVFRAVLDSA